jgi:hypothetical protein
MANCECFENFVGGLCEDCSVGNFGSACQPLPYINTVVPNDSVDEGGTNIRVKGVNFGLANSSSTFECLFSGVASVGAILTTDDSLLCQAPAVALAESSLLTSLQVLVNSVPSYNSVPFTFYGSCPAGQCEHGYCSFGRCRCAHGYRGDRCGEAVVPPLIAPPPAYPIEIVEGKRFTYAFMLQSGSSPVEFSLAGIPPEGMTVSTAGLLAWDSPVASAQTLELTVLATNEFSSTTASLFLSVTPAYYVRAQTETVQVVRPAQALRFKIDTVEFDQGRVAKNKLAHLWVQKVGSAFRRKAEVTTNSFGTSFATYLPYSSDAGRFTYGGEHPAYENVTSQGEFSILGVDVSRSSFFFSGYPGAEAMINDAFLFTFHGGTFTNITVAFDTVPNVQITSTLSSTEANETASILSMRLSVLVMRPLRGQVYFTLNTNEGASVSAFVYLDVRERRSVLSVTPERIDITIPRDGEAVYQTIELTNIGDRGSDAVQLIVPKNDVIRSVSGTTLPGLSVNGVTSVSFSFAAPTGSPVGKVFEGTVGFVANTTATSLEVRATVVSTISASLTVVAVYEGTYFDASRPNLVGADVMVRSLTVGTTFSNVTDGNGTAVFDDLVEDIYEITAQKLGHEAFRREIFLSAPGMTVQAFLQTRAVSYTFSVVPVPVFDKYVVQVETSFTTNGKSWSIILRHEKQLCSSASAHFASTNVFSFAKSTFTRSSQQFQRRSLSLSQLCWIGKTYMPDE